MRTALALTGSLGTALFGLHAAPRTPGRGAHRQNARRPPQFRPPKFRPPQFRPPQFRPPKFRPPKFRPPKFRPPKFRPPQFRPPKFWPAALAGPGSGSPGRPGEDRRALLALVAGGLALVLLTGSWVVLRDGEDARPAAAGRAALTLQLPLNAAELDEGELDRALDLAEGAGATEVSAGAPWWFLTQGRDPQAYDWRPLDRLVDAAAARRLGVRLQLNGTPDAVHPRLAASVPDPQERVWYPPRTPPELQAWGRFVAATVTHFKSRVSGFEIWNEPNIDTFWKPAPAPAEYARLLAEAYLSARRAWPSARVMFGGLSQNDVGYLERFYDEARRLFPDAGQHRYFFDELDVHPYTDGRSPDETSDAAEIQGQFGPVDKNFSGLWRMKAVMDENEGVRSGGGKSIILGEYGFTTQAVPGLPEVRVVPDRRRAYFLKRAVAVAQRMPFVTGMSWYAFMPDSATAPGWAITAADGSPSWTYQALADIEAGDGPTVRLPGPDALSPGPDPIRPVLSGLGPDDVAHTELFVDGVLRGQADGPEVRWDDGAPPAPGARVQVVLYTRDNHVWPSDMVTLSTGGSGS